MFLNNFRLVLVSNPLHYKRVVTKRRLHIFYVGSFCFFSVKSIIAFTFFRRDVIENVDCITAYVLIDVAYYTGPVFDFIFGTSCLIINYIILAVKLKQRSQKMKSLTNKAVDTGNNRGVDVNSKLTRANMITLTIFIVLYTPAILLSCILPFLPKNHEKYTDTVMDILLLAFFLNNVINPFIYYLLLRDFKEGYKILITCGKYKKEPSEETSMSTRISVVSTSTRSERRDI